MEEKALNALIVPRPYSVSVDPPGTQAGRFYEAGGTDARALFVFAHGAGAGQTHPFMVRYASGLAERGVDVATFDFPYMEAGRRAPDRAPVLEDAFRRAIVAAVRASPEVPQRLVIGGKSMGGRMATHVAAQPDRWPHDVPPLGAVVVFGYPLSPPGGSRVSPDRVSHLAAIPVPLMIVQGTRDTFGGPAQVQGALDGLGNTTKGPAREVLSIEGGDHSLGIRTSKDRSQAAVDAHIWDAVATFIADVA
jgi:hypothetical protein